MFKKKSKVTNGELKFDDSLDFNFDDDFDTFDSSESSKSRKPIGEVKKGVIGSIKNTLKSRSFWHEIAKKALPPSYDVVSQGYDEITSTAQSTYDESLRLLKPELNAIGRKLNAIVPENYKLAKKITNKLSPTKEYFNPRSKEVMDNEAIASMQAQVFGQAIEESQTKREVRDRIESRVKEVQDHRRHQLTSSILSSVNDHLAHIRAYQTNPNQNYQKRSLELMYRSYVVQAELLKTTQKYNELYSKQYEAIVRNTGLPEFVKITNSEKFKDIARTKIMTGIQSSFKSGLDRIKNRAMEYVNAFQYNLEQGAMGLESIEAMIENNRQMKEMGMGESQTQLLASFVTNLLLGKGGDKAAKYISKKAGDGSKVSKTLAKLARYYNNPMEMINSIRDNPTVKKYLEKEGASGNISRALDEALELMVPTRLDSKVSKDRTKNLNDPAILDKKYYRSITDVIPGLLSRILQEQMAIRLGGIEGTPRISYDWAKGKFVGSKVKKSETIGGIGGAHQVKSFGYDIDQSMNAILGNERLTQEQRDEIRKFMAKIATHQKLSFTKAGVTKTQEFRTMLSKHSQDTLDYALSRFENSEEDKLKLSEILVKNQRSFNYSYDDARLQIEKLIEDPDKAEILEDAGIIKLNADGDYDIDLQAYINLISEHHGGISNVKKPKGYIDRTSGGKIKKKKYKRLTADQLVRLRRGEQIDDEEEEDLRDKKFTPDQGFKLFDSDRNVKTNVSLMDNEKILKAMSKLKGYIYNYKEGSKSKITGKPFNSSSPNYSYMAQDVKSAFGNVAAPNGVMVDYNYMTTMNTQAINALNEKQATFSENTPDVKNILEGIFKNTKTIIDIMQNFKLTKLVSSEKEDTQDKQEDLIKTIMDKLKYGFTTAQCHLKIKSHKLKRGVGDLKNKIVDLPKTEAYEKIQDSLWSLGDSLYRQAGLVSDKLKSAIPSFKLRTSNFIEKSRSLGREWLNQAKDLYISGFKTPIISAELMKRGYYVDKFKNPILNMEDLKNLKTNLYNQSGEVVLTLEQVSKDLYDSTGKNIRNMIGGSKDLLFKAMSFGKDAFFEGINRGKRITQTLTKTLSKKYEDIKEGFKKNKPDEEIKVKSKWGFRENEYGNLRKIYKVLLEIRDLLSNGDHGGMVGGVGNSDSPISSDESSVPTTPSSRYHTGRGIEGVLNTARNLLGGVSGKLKGVVNGDTSEEVGDQLKDINSQIRNNRYVRRANIGLRRNKLFKKASGFVKKGTGFLNNGKLGNVLGRAKGMGNGVLGFAGGVFSNLTGSLQAPQTPEQPTGNDGIPAQTEEYKKGIGSQTKFKSLVNNLIPISKRKWFDRDGDGKREGSWEDQFEAMVERDKNRTVNQATTTPEAKYRNTGNGLLNMLGGMFSNLSGKLGGLFSAAGDVLDMSKGMAGNSKSILGKLKTIGTKVKLPTGIMSRLTSIGGSTLGRFALGSAGRAAVGTAASAVSSSGFGTAVASIAATAATALAALVASPVAMSALAVAGVGAVAFAGYKAFKRYHISDFERLRLLQYGFGVEETSNYHSKLYSLEQYFENDRIGYGPEGAYIIKNKVDVDKLFDIMDIDKNIVEDCQRFLDWLNKRFKPFYLTHKTALYSLNEKLKLNTIEKESKETISRYLEMVSYENGPYDYRYSPFIGLDLILSNKNKVKELIDQLKNKHGGNNKNKLIKELANKELKLKTKNHNDKNHEREGFLKTIINKANTLRKSVIYKTSELISVFASQDGESKELGAGSSGTTLSKIWNAVNSSQSTQNIKVAPGPLLQGAGGMEYIKAGSNVNLTNLNKEILTNLLGMAEEYGKLTGKKIPVNSAFRSYEDQLRLYRRDPSKAAKPGRSLHEVGLAVDINQTVAGELEQMGLMRKYGFTRPVGGEPWHLEPIGIQGRISEARNSEELANHLIAESRFKGGGGVGSDPNSPLGKRDDKLSEKIMTANATEVTSQVTGTGASNQNLPFDKPPENETSSTYRSNLNRDLEKIVGNNTPSLPTSSLNTTKLSTEPPAIPSEDGGISTQIGLIRTSMNRSLPGTSSTPLDLNQSSYISDLYKEAKLHTEINAQSLKVLKEIRDLMIASVNNMPKQPNSNRDNNQSMVQDNYADVNIKPIDSVINVSRRTSY